MTKKKRLLLTGATGFLGSRLLGELAESCDVTALVRRPPEDQRTGVRYVSVDLSGDWPSTTLPVSVDVVIHLAHSMLYKKFPEEVADIFNVNVASTVKLLDYARKVGVGQFIYISTGGVHQLKEALIRSNEELNEPDRLHFYWGTKTSSELLAGSYAGLMDVLIIRPVFFYGRGQQQSRFVPVLVNQIVNRKTVMLYGTDGGCFNPAHVSDIARYIKASVGRPGSRQVDLAGPEVLTFRKMADIIGKKMGIEPVYGHIQEPPTDFTADNEPLISFSDRPLISFQEGVEEVIAECLDRQQLQVRHE